MDKTKEDMIKAEEKGESDWNLSDKWIKSWIEGNKEYYLGEDVREFVKRLLDYLRPEDFSGNSIHEIYGKGIILGMREKIIDTAGEKLI